MKPISELLKTLDIKPHNIDLYECAFTHSSYNADAGTKHHDYERLEFLGDSVLGLIVAELAFLAHKDMGQGELTKLKSSLVSSSALSSRARMHNFHDYIKVGNSFNGDISKSNKLLEDVFEAFIGALFLDLGFKLTRKFIISFLYKDIQRFNVEYMEDYKSKLQESIQSEHRESVVYTTIKEEGPAHDRIFHVQVTFDGIILGEGSGSSKKSAEQCAAKDALAKKAIY